MRGALRAWGRRGIWRRKRRKRRWRFWIGCADKRGLTQRTQRKSTEFTESWPVEVEVEKAAAEPTHSKGGTIDRFSRLAALRPARGVATKPAELRAPDETDSLSRLLGAGIARNHYGEHLAIRNWFSTPEFAEPSPAALELLTKPTTARRADLKIGHHKLDTASRHARAALENPEKWLFLDTETTGLAGGTGTYAFLVGLAWWDAGGLQVEQLFLRDFSEEHSLLHELAARLAERPVLVTFNGKSFDWPLLENRLTMTRAIKGARLAAHLDLLHPARALWKLRLGSVRLVELERHVLDAPRLGSHREDDVLSSLIP